MNPLVSIVLPSYNGAKYIAASIQSCLSLTFRDFELTIVNDCSSDDTLSIAEKYALQDARIRIISNKVNKKLPLSLNAGFEAARGRYHTWTSDDNIYAPDALEYLVSEMQNDPEAGFIYTNYTIIDENGKVTGKRIFGDINEKFTAFQGCSACFLYKGELFQTLNGYNPSAFLIEDYDFFVRSFLETKVLYRDRTDLYFYREHQSSLTSRFGSSVNDISKFILERQMPKLEAKLPPAQITLLYRKYAAYYAIQKNQREGYGFYLKKLSRISKSEAVKTVLYVFVVKAWNAIAIPFHGLIVLFRQLFDKK